MACVVSSSLVVCRRLSSFVVVSRRLSSSLVVVASQICCHWGKLLQVTLHGCVTCQFATLFHCDLHDNDMSRKKRDAFRCTGAAFCEIRRLPRSSIGISVWRVVFLGVGCGRAIGICVSGCGIEARFSWQVSAEMAILVDGSVLRMGRNHSKRVVWCKFC